MFYIAILCSMSIMKSECALDNMFLYVLVSLLLYRLSPLISSELTIIIVPLRVFCRRSLVLQNPKAFLVIHLQVIKASGGITK
jgi:hypothetical protein